MVNQLFYDALFDLIYNMGMNVLDDSHLSALLDCSRFNLNDIEEIKLQFGDYTDQLNFGIMCRRLDELDIIIEGTYVRQDDIKRYGDIWRKKSLPYTSTDWDSIKED